jgi:EAL domain-containing protein (putative c-di-GMP-specific phosphodiesterase class I)
VNVFRFLTKPCAPALLAATVDEALQAQIEVRRQVAAASAEAAEAAALDRAIAGLRVVVQPIVGADAGGARAVRAWEALTRTTEPTLANPSTLFDVAGRRGRLWEVERRVRAAAAAIVPRVPADGLLFCNIEAQSLEDPELYAPEAPLTQVADRVVLEITERGVIADLDACMRAVGRLRALGFRIAIDDFGAGYAGLGTFGAVEPDIVKFDMDLVRHIDRSPTQARVIGSMLALCRELGIRTVAEGVESAAERDTLERLGFDLLQGYWFARPGEPFPDVFLES